MVTSLLALCLATTQDVQTPVAVIARFSDIRGDVDTEADVEYGDLWGTGFGLGVDSSFLWPIKRGPWWMGGYVSLGFDHFQGDEVRGDIGLTLEADDLLTAHLIGGFKIALAPENGGFYFDGRAGVGPVLWTETDGELNGLGVTLFDTSLSAAAELAAHAGFISRGGFFMGAGFAVRGQTKPEDEDLDFDGLSSALVTSLELEIGFRF
jgi:hypothetical protein